MVKNDFLYLFIGEDLLAKDLKLKKIKELVLDKETQDFNLDILYAKDLKLRDLQEKIIAIPANSKKRLIVIKDAENLKEEVKDFIIKYVKKPYDKIVLVIDFKHFNASDVFLKGISGFAEISRFKEQFKADTFTLSRQIEIRKMDQALRVLNQLLKDGEKPERVIGGLRYILEKEYASGLETKRKLKILLVCDVDIKTGKLKPDFALEKMVIKLCSFPKS